MKWGYHPSARRELDDSADWYEAQKPGLGSRFLDEVDDCIASILQSPQKWRRIDRNVRRVLMESFPFTIFYTVRGDSVEILAVYHHSRRPEGWRGRL